MKRARAILVGAAILLLPGACWVGFAMWNARAKATADAARRAFREYDERFQVGEFAAVRDRVTGQRASELADEAAFQAARRDRPVLSLIRFCNVDDARATLRLRGSRKGRGASGDATMLKDEAGRWRVEKEAWTLATDPPAPAASLPADLAGLVDRVGGTDAMEASKAWLELGARYQSSAAYLAEVKPALWDERPVHFQLSEETMTSAGRSFRYFSPKSGPKGTPVRAETVGESLRYFLWQYEDVSNSGFQGTFDDWWDGWAPALGLPGAVPLDK